MKVRILALSVLLSIIHDGIAEAQTTKSAVSQADIDANRLKQQQLNDAIRAQASRQPSATAVAPATPAEAFQLGGATFAIKDIVIENDTVTRGKYRRILRKYQGTMLGSQQLIALIGELDNYYASLGYVTSVVTLPKQNLASGRLALQVKWGRVAGFHLNGRTPQSATEQRQLSAAMPGVIGEILNIHMVDQIVENMSNGGQSVKVLIKPAESYGYSWLDVNIVEKSHATITTSLDNSGSERNDGYYKFNAGLTLPNLLGLNDQFYLGGGYRFFNQSRGNAEKSAFLSYTVPYGYWSANASLAAFDTRQLFAGSYGIYQSKSSLDAWSVKVSRVLERTSEGKTFAWLQVGRKVNANYFENILIDVNSKAYTQYGVGIGTSTHVAGGALYADLSWSKDAPWFASDTTPSIAGGPSARYQVVNSNVSWQRGFAVGALRPYVSLKGALQYSAQPLLGQNKFLLGDEYSVRGYKDDPLSGDKGAYVSGTLSLPTPTSGFLKSLTSHVGLDTGVTKNNGARNSWNRITGVVAGADFTTRDAAVSVMAGYPISASVPHGSGPTVYVDMSYRFSL